MSTSFLYKMHALALPTGVIPQISSRSLNPGIERVMINGDGKINPEFYGLMARNPVLNCSTPAIYSALNTLGGFYLFQTTATMYMAKLALGGGYVAGANHAKFTGSFGCVVPRRISVRHNDKRPTAATFDFDTYFLSTDGTTDGFAYSTTSVSLPTLAVANEIFTLGQIKINGTVIKGTTGFDYDFGYHEIIHASGGEVWPTFGGYDRQNPKFTITGADAQLWDNVAQAGTAQGGTASTFHLQKVSPTGRVAAGTAQHIKFTMTAGQFEPGGQRETDEGETEFTVDVYPMFDGTNPMIAQSLASTIV